MIEIGPMSLRTLSRILDADATFRQFAEADEIAGRPIPLREKPEIVDLT